MFSYSILDFNDKILYTSELYETQTEAEEIGYDHLRNWENINDIHGKLITQKVGEE